MRVSLPGLRAFPMSSLKFPSPRSIFAIFTLALLATSGGTAQLHAAEPSTPQPEAANPPPLPDIEDLLSRIPRTEGTDRGYLRIAVEKLFAAEAFDRIEALATRLRTEPLPVFLDGTPALERFYAGLSSAPELQRRSPSEQWQSRYRRWQDAFPSSPTRPVAEAEAYTDFAWQARGAGWSKTVTSEGWSLFAERLTTARTLLEAAPAACPHHAAVMQTVALGQSWSREDYETLFNTATSAHPTYFTYYFKKAHWLLPRWHGKPGELERWAAAEALSGRAGAGHSIYARIHWSESHYIEDATRWSVADGGFDWPLNRQAFDDLLAATPGSTWNRIAFARFAWLARDRDTFRRVLASVPPGHHGHPFAAGETEIARRWAGLPSTVPPGPPSTANYAQPASFEALALSPDGTQLALGDRSGHLRILDSASLRLLRQINLDQQITDLSWSPDGATLAAALTPLHSDSPAVVKTYAPATLQRRATSPRLNFEPRRLRYAPDGRLFLAGGFNYGKPALHLIAPDGSTQSLAWLAKHNHPLTSVALSPDSQHLYASCNHGLSFHQAHTGTETFATGQQLHSMVEEIAASPDGAWLAAGTRGNPRAELALWSARGEPQRKPARVLPSRDGGYFTLAWNPDSTRLAYAGEDGLVNVLDPATGKTIACFTEHLGAVTALAWSPDGRRLYSASRDGSIRAWSLQHQFPL